MCLWDLETLGDNFAIEQGRVLVVVADAEFDTGARQEGMFVPGGCSALWAACTDGNACARGFACRGPNVDGQDLNLGGDGCRCSEDVE